MIHEFSIGCWPAVILQDSQSGGQAARMASNWTPEWLASELKPFGVSGDVVSISYNLMAVQTPVGWVLMDGGQGTLTGGQGKLLMALAEARLSPDDIALIFISHAHADHYGALIDEQTGAFVFPNASYVIGAAEWEFVTSAANLADLEANSPPRYEAVMQRLMPVAPRLKFCKSGDEIAPGMTAVDAPGHTPGHLALMVENGGERVLYIADAAIHPIHLKYPDAQFFNDSVPEKSPESRRALIHLARETGARIFACHFAFPGFYHVPDDWPFDG